MEIEKSTKDKSKSILVIAVIILVGALFGVVGYLVGNKNNNTVIKSEEQITQEVQEVENKKEINVAIEKTEGVVKNDDEDIKKIEDIKDEIADWQTYLNEESGYEIKYPSNWIIISDWKFITDATGMSINFCGPEYKSKVECSTGGKGNNPVIKLRDDMPDYKEERYCALNKESIFCKESLILFQKNIKVDNRDGIITKFKDMNYGSIYVNWKKDSIDEKTYELSAVGLKEYSDYQDIFDKMISTFRFTN